MPPLLTIDADASQVISALTTLGDRAAKHVKAAARVTADAIDREATARVARRTGQTARGIEVVETENGEGWLVVATNPEMPGLPGWLEHGTRSMEPRPFLFASARLEEGPHRQRVVEAVNAAIEEAGLGD